MSSISPGSDIAALQSHFSKAYRDLEETKDAEIKREQKNHQKDVSDLDSSYRAVLNRKDEETNHLAETVRNTAKATNAQDREEAREKIEKLQRDSYNNRGLLASAIPLAEHQKSIQQLADTEEKRHQMDMTNAQHNEDNLRELIHEIRDHDQAELKKAKEENSANLSELAATHKKQSMFEEADKKNKIQSMKDLVRTEEASQKAETKSVEEASSRYMNKLKKNIAAKEGQFDDQLRNGLRDKDTFLNKTLNQQNLESNRTLKDLEKIYSNRIEQLNIEKKHQDEAAFNKLQSTVENDHEQLNKTLSKQAEAHGQDREKSNQLNATRYQSLEEELKRRSNPTHTVEIPPALENKIRHGIVEQYEKTINTELDRNKAAQEKLAEKYGSNYRQALEAAQDKETLVRKQTETEKAQQRAEFYDTLSTTQKDAEIKNREKDSAFEMQTEKLHRKFAYALERQKHEYEGIIEGMRSESETKLMSVREEDRRITKGLIKSVAEKQNEILKDYDRRLSEQREQYEFMIDDLKNQSKTEIHDVERRSKQELEIQSKSYDQKMMQIEEQNKEHERYLAQNYQEQLERLRKSYELNSQQKKS